MFKDQNKIQLYNISTIIQQKNTLCWSINVLQILRQLTFWLDDIYEEKKK